MTCRHCGGRIALVVDTDVIPYRERYVHTDRSRAHGYRATPGFVTCPIRQIAPTTTATP